MNNISNNFHELVNLIETARQTALRKVLAKIKKIAMILNKNEGASS